MAEHERAKAVAMAMEWKDEAGREGVLAREVLRLRGEVDELLPDAVMSRAR